MNCEEAQLKISELLTEGKSLSSDAPLQEHLQGCAGCQAYAHDLSEVMVGLLTAAAPAEAPAGLKSRLFGQLQGGLTCEQAQALVVENLTGGIPVTDQQPLRTHLEKCVACQGYVQDMQTVTVALAHSASRVQPSALLKGRVLQAAKPVRLLKRPASQIGWWGLGLAATVSGVLWVSSLVTPPAVAQLVASPSVVVGAGSTLVFANNATPQHPIALLTDQGETAGIPLDLKQPPHFTEGVASGNEVYLLDTSNQLLIVVDVEARKVVRTHPVHAGASGLSVKGQQAYVKCALSGYLTSINSKGFITEIKLAPTREIPKEQFMDAVLQQGDTLLVTHHEGGKIFRVNPSTLKVQATLNVGGAPVALALGATGVLVLDHEGRLLELSGNKISRVLQLSGHPDKLTVASGHAYLTDREGQVSKIDLKGWKPVMQKAFQGPMDITSMPGGHLVLANGKAGITVLDQNLEVLEQLSDLQEGLMPMTHLLLSTEPSNCKVLRAEG